VYDGEFGQTLAKKMEEKTGMKIFGWAENGFRTFSNNKRPVATPADMKGLKIRTMENPVHMKMVEDLGASAIPVTFAELYTALSQGTVDGQENGLTLTYTNKLYEALKYITDDNHIYDVYCVAMSRDSYNKLPKDLQELLDKKMREFIELERQLNVEYEQTIIKAMKEAGIEFTTLQMSRDRCSRTLPRILLTWPERYAGDDWSTCFLSEVEKAQKKLV
jgi:C4-dicarboxylate-binding protein DctP